MNLIYLALKKPLPELNVIEIKPPRILEVLESRFIHYEEVTMKGEGAYVCKNGKDYVFLRQALAQLVYHETLAYETTHALTHSPAKFLLWRHNLEAEAMALICMMPETMLKYLNYIKHQLDPESYELLMRRNEIKRRWNL